MINADVNIKNLLIKKNVIKDLFGTLVIMNVNVINHVTLKKIQITKIVSVEKRSINKLVEECNKNIDGNKTIQNYYKNVCNYCIKYIVLFVITFFIIIDISSAFIYFYWYLEKSNTNINLLLQCQDYLAL